MFGARHAVATHDLIDDLRIDVASVVAHGERQFDADRACLQRLGDFAESLHPIWRLPDGTRGTLGASASTRQTGAAQIDTTFPDAIQPAIMCWPSFRAACKAKSSSRKPSRISSGVAMPQSEG